MAPAMISERHCRRRFSRNFGFFGSSIPGRPRRHLGRQFGIVQLRHAERHDRLGLLAMSLAACFVAADKSSTLPVKDRHRTGSSAVERKLLHQAEHAMPCAELSAPSVAQPSSSAFPAST